jgi:hypothetical protein
MMAVSMIENWTNILGLVQAVGEYQELHGFDSVEMLVEHVEPVEGFPDLVATYLAEADEPRLSVLMPVEIVSENEITEGVLVECRVRRAGLDRMFVHRDYVMVRRPT